MGEVSETHLRWGDVPLTLGPRLRVAILIGCGALFLTCVAVVGGLLLMTSDSIGLLIGSTFGWQIGIYAELLGWATATVALLTVRCRGWRLLLAAPARVVAVGGLLHK